MKQSDICFDTATIDIQFHTWLIHHPEAVDEFVAIARQFKAKGCTRYSADGIFHILRWNAMVQGRDHQGYRVNNNYSSRMARLVMQRCDDLRGFFQLRKLKGGSDEYDSSDAGGASETDRGG